MEKKMQTHLLQAEPDYLAPDGSEIRELLNLADKSGGLAYCTLPSGQVSVAQRHKAVGEIWYCVQGLGQVWRKPTVKEQSEQPVDVLPGSCLTIEPEEHFQFRNTGQEPLVFIIATIPSWPGPQQAERVQGHWGTNS